MYSSVRERALPVRAMLFTFVRTFYSERDPTISGKIGNVNYYCKRKDFHKITYASTRYFHFSWKLFEICFLFKRKQYEYRINQISVIIHICTSLHKKLLLRSSSLQGAAVLSSLHTILFIDVYFVKVSYGWRTIVKI